MLEAGFRDHVATDGSLLGLPGRWRARMVSGAASSQRGDRATAWDVRNAECRAEGAAYYPES